MIHTARVAAAGLNLSLRRLATFRINLVFELLVLVTGLGATLLTVGVVFANTNSLAGWNRPEVIVLLGSFTIVSGVKRSLIDPNLGWLPINGIRKGQLDAYMLQPAPTLFLATLSASAPLATVDIVLGTALVGYGIHDGRLNPGPAAVLTWLALVIAAAVLAWSLGLIIASLAFWAPSLQLDVLYSALWQLGRYPADVYAYGLRVVITYVLPFASVATVPAGALTGRYDGGVIGVSLGLTAGFLVLANVIWRRGLRRYAGVAS